MKECKRCVMNDITDKTIRFDKNGNCNYCSEAYSRKEKVYYPNEVGKNKIEEMLKRIRIDSKELPYDCIMGISGGLDSSYLAYLGFKWGLRILAFHIDDGFDTPVSKSNIKKLCEVAKIDLVYIKPDKEQYYGLLKAYMKAGVPNLAVPQDNILNAEILKFKKHSPIKYFLSGANFSTECLLQFGNTHSASDRVNILDIYKKFGEKGIDKLSLVSEKEIKELFCPKTLSTYCPLDYIDYKRDRAFKELKDFCGFEYYGRKHLENAFTAFLQTYWLPLKFGVDKRTSHLSSMIVSGQMTKEEALRELEEPVYDEKLMNEYIAIIKEKLSISDDEFSEIMTAPTKQHTEYKTSLYNKYDRRIRPYLVKAKREIRKLLFRR